MDVPINKTFEGEIEETLFSFSRDTPRPAERRDAARHLTILRVGTLHIDDRRELCLIRNISAGGLMAHVYSPLARGQRVAAELRNDQPIAGSVNWIRGANVGIRFDAAIDVEAILASQAELDNGWRPRLPRVAVDRLATLRAGARIFAIGARDISQGGVKIETDHPFETGQEVVLTLERFRPLPGTIRWCHGGLAGIAFNQVIPFRELMDWLKTTS